MPKNKKWQNNVVIKMWYVVVQKSRFMNEQEAKALLSSLGIKTPLSKILLLGDILF